MKFLLDNNAPYLLLGIFYDERTPGCYHRLGSCNAAWVFQIFNPATSNFMCTDNSSRGMSYVSLTRRFSGLSRFPRGIRKLSMEA